MTSVVPADYRAKLKVNEKRDKYRDLARELKKTMEHESDGDNNYNWCARYSYQKISKETRGLGKKRTRGDRPHNSIVEIGQNTEKSPGNLRRLAVTQTPVNELQES